MIRICVVSDSLLFREGLVRILEFDQRLEIIATASNSNRLLAKVKGIEPESILLDISVPDSLCAIKTITELLPEVKVVVLGVPQSEVDVIACAEAGAAGYVYRDATVDELIQALECAISGRLVCSRRMAGALFRRIRGLAASRSTQRRSFKLTRREHQIINLVDKGLTNKEIASRLTIEVATVKNHVHNILEKLGVHTRGEAAAALRGSHHPELMSS